MTLLDLVQIAVDNGIAIEEIVVSQDEFIKVLQTNPYYTENATIDGILVKSVAVQTKGGTWFIVSWK